MIISKLILAWSGYFKIASKCMDSYLNEGEDIIQVVTNVLFDDRDEVSKLLKHELKKITQDI